MAWRQQILTGKDNSYREGALFKAEAVETKVITAELSSSTLLKKGWDALICF